MQNGKTHIRDWILYSQSKNALFCFKCLFFDNKRTLFENQDKGFTDWKTCYNKVSEHEKSLTHVQSVKSWHLRMINSSQCGIDKEMKNEILNYLSYWKNVLHRVVETLKFLTFRGLALRGTNEDKRCLINYFK